jgi:mannitol/fructose-specific phosphotransferase system IIA component (Ntr-type)
MMTERAYKHGFIKNKAAFLKDLWEREQSASTGMQGGIAIPHSRSGSAGSVVIAIARLSTPIEYESLDGSPVDLVFLIAASEDTKEYLQTLSLLAHSLKKPGLIAHLRALQTEHEMFDFLAHELDAN